MRNLLLSILLITILFLSGAQAQNTNTVAGIVEELRVAMIDADKTMLERLTSDSLSYGHSSGRIENKKEFIENIVSGKSDFATIDLSEQTISIADDVAVVRHVLTATTNDGGKPGSVKLKVLLIFTNQKGSWKLLARQAVKYV
jgi:hypothetical protein